jgi:hypothetical protein
MVHSRIAALTPAERREFRRSVIILEHLANSMEEFTGVAKKAYENFANDSSRENWQMMNCVYAFFIIQTSAFYDELIPNFLRIKGLKKTKEIVSTIAHFRLLYKKYHVRLFRNLLVHNRRTVGKGKKKRNRPITDADISKIAGIKSPTEYGSFSVAANRIVMAIKGLESPRSSPARSSGDEVL